MEINIEYIFIFHVCCAVNIKQTFFPSTLRESLRLIDLLYSISYTSRTINGFANNSSKKYIYSGVYILHMVQTPKMTMPVLGQSLSCLHPQQFVHMVTSNRHLGEVKARPTNAGIQ